MPSSAKEMVFRNRFGSHRPATRHGRIEWREGLSAFHLIAKDPPRPNFSFRRWKAIYSESALPEMALWAALRDRSAESMPGRTKQSPPIWPAQHLHRSQTSL